jgi:hypothetical protein
LAPNSALPLAFPRGSSRNGFGAFLELLAGGAECEVNYRGWVEDMSGGVRGGDREKEGGERGLIAAQPSMLALNGKIMCRTGREDLAWLDWRESTLGWPARYAS